MPYFQMYPIFILLVQKSGISVLIQKQQTNYLLKMGVLEISPLHEAVVIFTRSAQSTIKIFVEVDHFCLHQPRHTQHFLGLKMHYIICMLYWFLHKDHLKFCCDYYYYTLQLSVTTYEKISYNFNISHEFILTCIKI